MSHCGALTPYVFCFTFRMHLEGVAKRPRVMIPSHRAVDFLYGNVVYDDDESKKFRKAFGGSFHTLQRSAKHVANMILPPRLKPTGTCVYFWHILSLPFFDVEVCIIFSSCEDDPLKVEFFTRKRVYTAPVIGAGFLGQRFIRYTPYSGL